MILAAIESSGLVASVAIWADEKILAEYSVDYKKTHSQTLLPMLEEIVRMTQLDMSLLDAVAVSAGPGSFTGLRIGSATAKGLGLALDIPLIEVPTLDAMAFQLFGCGSLICPMMDARRGQVYTGLYTFSKEQELQRLEGPEAVPVEDVIRSVNERGQSVIFLGDGVPVYESRIREEVKVPFSFAPASASRQRAGALASLAAIYYKQGKTIRGDQHAPTYLRLSQAERERMERKKLREAAGNTIFRDMIKEDTAAASQLEKELFSQPWSKQALTDALDRQDSVYVAAVIGDELAGYCGLYLSGDEGFINQVAVKPAYQRQGIGKRMLANLLDKAAGQGMKACTLEVRVSNEKAIGLYQSLGFTKEGVRPGFYEDPKEDALIFWKR